jgi:hypothetical protein
MTIEGMKAHYNVIEFIDGQRACKDGKPHESGKSESYDAGYAAQYELEQMITTHSEGGDL